MSRYTLLFLLSFFFISCNNYQASSIDDNDIVFAGKKDDSTYLGMSLKALKKLKSSLFAGPEMYTDSTIVYLEMIDTPVELDHSESLTMYFTINSTTNTLVMVNYIYLIDSANLSVLELESVFMQIKDMFNNKYKVSYRVDNYAVINIEWRL